MSEYRHEAVVVANRLNQESRIDYSDYLALMDGLEEIDTLRERDAVLEELWAEFGNTPIDPETERIEEKFMGFEPGTVREDVWRWFDERHSRGVAYLMHQTPALSKFKVRVSQLRYGDAEVEAVDERAAKSIVYLAPEGINWFDSEITDVTVERMK